MNERIEALLAEQLELQRRQLANQERAISHQERSIAIQEQAVLRQRVALRRVWMFAAVILALVLGIWVASIGVRLGWW